MKLAEIRLTSCVVLVLITSVSGAGRVIPPAPFFYRRGHTSEIPLLVFQPFPAGGRLHTSEIPLFFGI